MNTIITLRRLIDLLAKAEGCDNHEAEVFFKAFTSQISEQLAQHETVTVKGLGEFSVNAENRVSFIPDKDLAMAVNEPFEMFVAEELDPEIPDEAINVSYSAPAPAMPEAHAESETPAVAEEPASPEIEPEVADRHDIEEIESPATEVEITVEPEPTPMPMPQPEPVHAPAPEPAAHVENPQPKVQQQPQPKPSVAPQPEIKPWDDEPEADREADIDNTYSTRDTESHGFPWFWTFIGLLFGLILGIALGFFAHDPIQEALEPSLAQEEEYIDPTELDELAAIFAEDSIGSQILDETPADTAKEAPKNAEAAATAATETEAPKQPSAQPQETKAPEIYETIRSGTNLAKLARKHYGQNVYWVYIYLENQDVIPNPNRVPEGVSVKIPPLTKYATQATEAERKAAAQKKVSEVLAKYPR